MIYENEHREDEECGGMHELCTIPTVASPVDCYQHSRAEVVAEHGLASSDHDVDGCPRGEEGLLQRGTLPVAASHNLIGLDRHLYCWIRDRNFHEVAPNAIQGKRSAVD